jgi:2-methylcitrate dehydratase PrpD
MTITHNLARFSSELDYTCLPEDVRDKALAQLADWLSNAAAGHTTPMGRALYEIASPQPAPGGVPLIGTLLPADPLAAALINAGAAHSTEYDDSDREGLVHPGAPVISAAWASADTPAVTGADLLVGIVAGYEVVQRLARAVNPNHYRYWHTTGTVGALGAAAAAARVLRLNPKETAWAIGLAGSQSAGLWEVLPDAPLAKNLHPAKAAHAGVLAAKLASKGIHGPVTILEGERGFFNAMVSGKVQQEDCLARLGERWLILEATIKAYPVCGHTMTPIEAALRIKDAVRINEIETLEIRANPVSIQIAGHGDPATEDQAKFSIPYCVALALVKGEVAQSGFTDEALADTAVKRVMRLTQLVPDDTTSCKKGQRPAQVKVRLKGGEVVKAVAHSRKGDPENPMTAKQRRTKFDDLSVPVWGKDVAEEIWDKLTTLDRVDHVSQWWRGFPQPHRKYRDMH